MRLTPQALDAEGCVLGSALTDNLVIDDIVAKLSAKDFYRSDHAIIFDGIVNLHSQGKPVDVLTLKEHLSSIKLLDRTEGIAYFSNLQKNTPSASSYSSYAQIVKQASMRREAINIAQKAIDSAYDESVDIESIIDSLSSAGSVIQPDSGDESLNMAQVMAKTVDEIEVRKSNGGELIGLSTGLNDLDGITGGLQTGLIILAARPAMGKSALALSIAQHNGLLGKSVSVFSLEMTASEIGMRAVSSLSGLKHTAIQNGNIDDYQFRQLTTKGSTPLAQTNIRIDDSTSLNVNQIKARCRKWMQRGNLDLVIIDYLGLLDIEENQSKSDSVGKVTRALKNLSKEMDIPVVLLCQLNRACENREDKRPRLSDLRDSGSIEQDANVVAFVYRDVIYNQLTEDKELTEILVRKNRSGRTGTARCKFKGEIQRFESC